LIIIFSSLNEILKLSIDEEKDGMLDIQKEKGLGQNLNKMLFRKESV
jgi:hypothetical protein